MKHSITPVLAALLIVAAFCWGYVSHKNRTFPYGFIERESEPRDMEKVRLDAEALKTLPYIMGKKVSRTEGESEKDGVVINEPSRAYNGYNLYNSTIAEKAYLMDMEGNIVHEWTGNGRKGWHHVETGSDGTLYAVRYRDGIIRLDKDSNTVFDLKMNAHHDLDVTEDGTVYAITEKTEPFRELYGDEDVVSDYITVVSPDGELVREIPLVRAVYDSPYRVLLPTFTDGLYNPEGRPHILHTNSIEVFDGRLEGRLGALYREGNILISCREINFIGILDPRTEKVIWGWGGSNIYRQHHASLLDNGDILLFDNGLQQSRVIELNPSDGSLVWKYGGAPGEYFFSRTRGAAQRLPNGNTLITVADNCYVMEVTGEGEAVWKYVNPRMFIQDGSEHRQAFYRVQRIAPSEARFLEADNTQP